MLVARAVDAAPRAAEVVRATLRVSASEMIVEATIVSGWHVNAHRPRDEFLIPTTVTVDAPAGMTVGDVVYPEPVERRLAFAGERMLLLYEGIVRFTAPVAGAASAPLRATLRYQACDETHCLPPHTLELTTTDAARPAAAAPGENEVAAWIARWGIGPTLLLVALVGVALNLTPCVYPLISVTVAYFGGSAAGGADGRVLGRALVYVLGICCSFSILGVTAALTGSLFGAALQRPAVLGGIALLLVALALGNFGLYTIRVPAAVMQRVARVGHGVAAPFFMGLTMGIVAAPCIGPLVAALLIFVGTQQSIALGFALFAALGLGMGAPYVGLAALAGRLRRLPRGGVWLVWVERIFGFVLLGMALFFAAPLLPAPVVQTATAALLVSAGVVLGFLGGPAGVGLRWARRAGGLALVALALGGLLGAETGEPIAWAPFDGEAVLAARRTRRPVLLDFEADWCLPCKEMDRTTFRDPIVVDAAREFVALKVDVTLGDDAANAVMERYRVTGVPTYVVLDVDGVERARRVGFVPADEMRDVLVATTAARDPPTPAPRS